MPRPDAACLGFRKVHSMNQGGSCVWKSHWKRLEWAHKWGGRGLRESPGWAGQTALTRWMEVQLWRPPARSVGLGTSAKEQWPLPARLLGESCPFRPHPDSRQFSSSRMSLVPFKLLARCWSSEGGGPSKSVQEPLRGTARDSRSPPTQPQSPVVSTARVTGTSLPGTGSLGRGLVWGWDPPSSGAFHSRDTPPGF